MTEAYRRYFESMPCYLSVQDADLRIVDANERFARSFGEWRGRFCYQVYKQRPEKCEDCPVERTFHDGQPHTSEQLVRTLGGREVLVLVHTMPISNGGGRPRAVMEMSTDITGIKRLQQQYRDSQRRYLQLFEEVPCYLSMQDRELNLIEANRLHREAFGTGYGCKCYQVYKQRDQECDPCAVRQTFADGQIHVHEEVVGRRDGRQMNVMVTTAPVFDAEGAIDAVIEMSTDITPIRELQSKLSSVGMVISTISHDLKGLLNGLDGGMYLVGSGLERDDRERLHKGWEMVTRNVERIRSTVLDILYYAKDRQPDWQEIRGGEVIEEVRSLMAARAASHAIALTAGSEAPDDRLEADPAALRSLLVNLVDNSLDACRLDRGKEQHQVSIRVTGTPADVCFEVADNGIGMSREVREKAFTLFFSSKGAGGTGLGLFIANRIAQAHGGRIELSSEPDRGSRFRVILPRRRTQAGPPDLEAAPLAAPPTTQPAAPLAAAEPSRATHTEEERP